MVVNIIFHFVSADLKVSLSHKSTEILESGLQTQAIKRAINA